MTCGGRVLKWPQGSWRAVLVLLIGALSSCGAPPSGHQPETLPLRLGVATLLAPPVPNSVLWLAKDDGFYQREGLDVSLLPLDGTPRVIAAMLAGDVDVGNVSTDQVLRLVSSGRADLRALHSPDPRQFFLVASSCRIARVDELRGATLAVSAIGGADDTTTRLVLRVKGIAADDLTFIAMGDPSARAAALVAGRVDATTISIGTWSLISTSAGVRELVSPEEYFAAAPLVAKVDAVMGSTLASKRNQLRRFTLAVLKAVRLYAQNREAWVAAMARRRPDMRPSMLAALWEKFRGGWAVDGGMEPGHLRTTASILEGSADFRGLPRVPVSRWTNLRDLDAALRQLAS